MSPLTKTTIVPTGNPNDVLNRSILKMIILHETGDIVQIADDLAKYPPNIERHVIWFKDPNENEIRELFGDLDSNFNEIAAFSLSTTNVIADYILRNEEIGFARVDEAFTNAGKIEFNR